jgi:hypothetical protein
MSLNEALLGKLADWQPPEGRQSVHVSDGSTGWGVTLTVERADQLGCLVWELALKRTPPASHNGDALAAWAERIAGRATGLLEPLKVVEVDPVRREAVLRSASPVERGEELYYYEVHLYGVGAATLSRYRSQRLGSAKREQVGFALTHEAVAKLAVDLTDVP